MAIELQDKLYTSAQVADILGVSLRTLYRYMEDGRIQSMRTASGRHRFTKDQIIDFLNAGNYEPEIRRDAPYPQAQQGFNPPVVDDPYDDKQNDFAMPGKPVDSSARYDKPVAAPISQPAPQTRSDTSDFSFYQPQSDNRAPFRQSPDDSFNSFGNRANTPDQQHATQNANTGFVDPSVPLSRPSSFGQSQPSNQILDEEEGEEDLFDFDLKDYSPSGQSNVRQPQPMNSPQQGFQRPTMNDNVRPAAPQNMSRPNAGPIGHRNSFINERFSNQQSASQTNRPYHQDRFAPVFEEKQVSQQAAQNPLPDLNIRYYKSEFNDLIELAKKIKETAINKDLEYAFTLNAGLSLHFLINPFTILHFYVNPEDIQMWKGELRLVPARDASDSNIGVLINTDVVFMPTREIGGFRVVDDKILLKDLMKLKDEELVKKFRQHLISA